MTRAQIHTLAEQTSDAYSFDRYGTSGWRSAIKILARHGLGPREIEAVLRSKWMRWAADARPYRYGHAPGLAIIRQLHHLTPVEVKELVDGTFTAEE